MRRLASSQRFVPYVFVLPFVVSIALFYVYPAVSTVVMSFQEVVPGQSHFIGLKNYNRLINPEYFKALKNSILYDTDHRRIDSSADVSCGPPQLLAQGAEQHFSRHVVSPGSAFGGRGRHNFPPRIRFDP